MSNFLAIATVSATLSQIVRNALPADVTGAEVRVGRPFTDLTQAVGSIVNLYLYQVTPNAAYRNADLPTRTNDRSDLRQRPQAALDLNYLVTFYGDETQLIPERLLGAVVRTLHAQPVLTRQNITDTITDPAYSYLAESDLAEQIELVKFTPTLTSTEELSRLWSIFLQVPYTTSLAYQGTVVLIESEVTPQTPLPVEARNVYVLPTGRPLIENITAQTAAGDAIDAIDRTVTLFIQGMELRGDVTKVRLGVTEVIPPNTDISNTQIKLDLALLSASDLRAGVQALQVIHELLIGTPATPHTGVESNAAPFVLHPLITAVSSATVTGPPREVTVTVTVDPIVGKDQRVELMLNETVTTDPKAFSYALTARTADLSTLDFPIGDVPAGTYFVHLQIDGALSVYLDGGGQYTVPEVTIT